MNGLIKKIISPRAKDLGGFEVKRILPIVGQRMVGPWIFFDHMGPATFKKGEGVNVRPHPHINLATVTYTFDGEIWHRDSLGNSEPIRPGELNLMVAGKGIVHSERTREELRVSGQKLDGLQLWMALPEDLEEIDPDFLHYGADEIPSVVESEVPVRVMIGEAYRVKSPVKQFASTLYLEARMKKGQTLILPDAQERGVYMVKGSLKIDNQVVDQYHMAILREGAKVMVEAVEDTFLAVIGGEKLTERYMEWNFVSSRKERIEQAKKQWQDGKFPKVVGDEEEYIPYP
ncbi:pirin family protein [Bacteriovorax sp. Seq25_V]|uniref:pirin family protein n=1 Tax=Bacteriovorax sp. Seq25_V TaxID=1201288 RepID=UPI000389F0A2|nr:pirin family protein [Bacteriovorax sp. Seq25_V]EQC45262.1 pirin family protein [Bacteriovorax sp. Seq25_V]